MGLASKLEDEQSLVGKVQKSIKELQGRIEEMEEELEAERQARAKAERQRSDLAREMESLGERLNEVSFSVVPHFYCISPFFCIRPVVLPPPRLNSTRRGRARYLTSPFINLETNITSLQKVTKLRKDLEECRIQHDATLVSLKKKQADSIAEVIFVIPNSSWI